MERAFSAPLGDLTHGRLVIVSGMTHLSLRADPALPALYRAKFAHLIPDVSVEHGTVSVKYRQFPWLDWLLSLRDGWSMPRAEIVLNGRVAWEIDMCSGASWLDADLRDVTLERLSLRGGATKAEIRLPRPTGAVPVRLIGGISDVVVHRPPGTAAQSHVRGGISSFRFDAQHVGGFGSDTHWGTPDAATASHRYDFAITGGVSSMTLDAQ